MRDHHVMVNAEKNILMLLIPGTGAARMVLMTPLIWMEYGEMDFLTLTARDAKESPSLVLWMHELSISEVLVLCI